ncbi:MAG: carboxypeptidase-like regulatory domain-containing protein, partial [Gemmatimonadaceae bacterium]
MTTLLFFALALCAPSVGAQLVRGTVTERTSGAPLSGVLVTLVNEASRTVGSALTSERGDYGIRAPEAGRYRIDAKRIGVRRFSSPVFDLTAGETREINVQLDALLYSLPEVVITAIPLCNKGDKEAGRVAALWDEARTALAATQISLRDRLFNARVVRYVRQIDPANFKVINETRSDVQG